MINARRLAAAALCCLALSGCGLKGDLYLPEQSQAPAAAESQEDEAAADGREE